MTQAIDLQALSKSLGEIPKHVYAAFTPGKLRWSLSLDVAVWVRFSSIPQGSLRLLLNYVDATGPRSQLVDHIEQTDNRVVMFSGTIELPAIGKITAMSLQCESESTHTSCVVEEVFVKRSNTAKNAAGQ